MPAAYLLLGPEAGEKTEFIDQIRKKLPADTETHSFYVMETKVTDIVSLLRNGSLFSTGKAVFVKDADQIKKREDIDLLVAYLREPAPDTVLFLLSPETKLDEKLEKALTQVKPAPEKKVFWELFENQKEQWIRNFFAKRSIAVDEEAIETVLELVGNTTDALRKECENLALFFGDGATLDADSVEDLLYHSREETVFSLFDAMIGGNLEQALEILDTMLLMKDTDPVGIFAGLAWQFNRLKSWLLLVDETGDEQSAFQTLRIFGKKAQQQFRNAARSYSLRQTEEVISLIARYDARCRSTPGRLEDTLMTLFLYAAMVKKGDLAGEPAFTRELP